MLHPAFSIERLRSLMQRSLQYGDGTFRPTALSPRFFPAECSEGLHIQLRLQYGGRRAPYSTLSSVWTRARSIFNPAFTMEARVLHIQPSLQYGRRARSISNPAFTMCKDRRDGLQVFGDILYTWGNLLTSGSGPRKSTSAIGCVMNQPLQTPSVAVGRSATG